MNRVLVKGIPARPAQTKNNMFDIEAIYEAQSVHHAVTLLREHPQAHIIAGGSDVLVKVREGSLASCELVSIQSLNELRNISLDAGGTIRVGALCSFNMISKNEIISSLIPVLGEAAGSVGGPQIRMVGTIGGNIANGVTSADTASTLLAFDASLEYTSAVGSRIVPMCEHYISAGKTALRHDEILTAVLISKSSYERSAGSYIKYAMREAMDIAVLGCSANVQLSGGTKTIERVRIAFGVAGPVPIRAKSAEVILAGIQAGSARVECAIEDAAGAVLKDIKARDSWRASREFREHIAKELVRRTLRTSISRAVQTV